MIVRNGNKIAITDGTPVSRIEKGVYEIKLNRVSNSFYLQKIDEFNFPDKIYGDDSVFVDRCIKKYNSVSRNLGVLLSGIKGSGKTVTAKKICELSGLPVLIISEPFFGDEFITFITSSELGNVAILIDEFEKIYDSRDDGMSAQNEMLRILDGPYSTHNLFVFTSNSEKLNSCLINRPSRIFYHKRYVGLEEPIIREVANDMLENKEYIEELVNVCGMLPVVTFDVISSIIKECNLFNESPKECVKYMNICDEDFKVAVYQIIGNNRFVDATYDTFVRFGDCMEEKKFKVNEEGVVVSYNYEYLCMEDAEHTKYFGEFKIKMDDGTEFIIHKINNGFSLWGGNAKQLPKSLAGMTEVKTNVDND